MTAQVLTQAQALIQNQEVILHRMSHRKRNEHERRKGKNKMILSRERRRRKQTRKRRKKKTGKCKTVVVVGCHRIETWRHI